MMPDNAAYGSSFEIIFKASDRDKNKFTQAYYAYYKSGDADKLPVLGDILAEYDGEWEYVVPDDAPQADKDKPEGKRYI